MLDLWQGWSWEEIARFNELCFMGALTLAGVFAAGLSGVFR